MSLEIMKTLFPTSKVNGLPNFISFDNDLGLDGNEEVAPDGYACAKWLVYEFCKSGSSRANKL